MSSKLQCKLEYTQKNKTRRFFIQKKIFIHIFLLPVLLRELIAFFEGNAFCQQMVEEEKTLRMANSVQHQKYANKKCLKNRRKNI